MKSREIYYNRLAALQTYFKENPKSTLNDAAAYFTEIPKGTISSTLSFMYQTGHLVKNGEGRYSVPAILSSPKQIAGDITRNQKKKQEDIKNGAHLISQNGRLFSVEPLDTPRHASTIQKQIEDAIALLKSQGYKILAKKTEYAEI
jgi:hypothetical protein